jgi:DNA-binding transcriptional ArsR family regulator
MPTLPYELNLAIGGLNNTQRQEILFVLNDVDKMSFSDLNKKTGIEGPSLSNHLKILSRTLLAEHFYDHKIGNDNFSYYRISPLGERLLQNLLGTLYVKVEKTRICTTIHRVVEKETTSYPSVVLKPSASNKVSIVTATT